MRIRLKLLKNKTNMSIKLKDCLGRELAEKTEFGFNIWTEYLLLNGVPIKPHAIKDCLSNIKFFSINDEVLNVDTGKVERYIIENQHKIKKHWWTSRLSIDILELLEEANEIIKFYK